MCFAFSKIQATLASFPQKQVNIASAWEFSNGIWYDIHRVHSFSERCKQIPLDWEQRSWIMKRSCHPWSFRQVQHFLSFIRGVAVFALFLPHLSPTERTDQTSHSVPSPHTPSPQRKYLEMKMAVSHGEDIHRRALGQESEFIDIGLLCQQNRDLVRPRTGLSKHWSGWSIYPNCLLV